MNDGAGVGVGVGEELLRNRWLHLGHEETSNADEEGQRDHFRLTDLPGYDCLRHVFQPHVAGVRLTFWTET